MKRRLPSGFTIVEGIIFLAVSSVLLITSISFFSGREADTRFSQSMRDINSKVQDWINDVSTGFTGSTSGVGPGNVNCIAPGNNAPRINPGAGPNSPECIFLGKAIQFTTKDSPPTTGQESIVYVYSVFGRRSNSSDEPVDNLVDAKPVAAVGPGMSGNADFTESYTLKGGAKVKKILAGSGYCGGGSCSVLASFYLSFNPGSQLLSGSSDLKAYQYPRTANYPKKDNDLMNCLSLRSDCGGEPRALSDWQICFEDSAEEQTAVLRTISNNGINPTTKVEFTAC